MEVMYSHLAGLFVMIVLAAMEVDSECREIVLALGGAVEVVELNVELGCGRL